MAAGSNGGGIDLYWSAFESPPVGDRGCTSGGPVGLIYADFPGDDWRAINVPFSKDEIEISLWSARRFSGKRSTHVQNVRALIHRHLTLPFAQQLGNVFYLDSGGGMPGQGHFTFVNLDSLELIRGPGLDASAGSRRNRRASISLTTTQQKAFPCRATNSNSSRI